MTRPAEQARSHEGELLARELHDTVAHHVSAIAEGRQPTGSRADAGRGVENSPIGGALAGRPAPAGASRGWESDGEELSGVSEGLELQGVAGGVQEEHRPLLARLAPKAQVWLDDELCARDGEPLREVVEPVDLEDQTEVGNRYVVAVDGVGPAIATLCPSTWWVTTW